MIEYICDVCKKKKSKNDTRTVVIHCRKRKIHLKFPVLNPDRKKLGTRVVCLKCLKQYFDYEEIVENE